MNYAADRRLGLVVDTGTAVVSLRAAADAGHLDGLAGLDRDALRAPTLNAVLGAGRLAWDALHERVAALTVERALHVDRSALQLRLAIDVGDYVDFYSSIHHATNLGRILRPGTDPLLPNWRHLPVSYHGRAGTVVVSGTPIRRPRGLVVVAGSKHPEYRPTARLDIELEVAVVVGGATELGVPVPIDDAGEHIFGIALLNDWSARDIQAYEYQPLGPHLGKSFATSMSAWITPIADLRPYLRAAPVQDPLPSPHLRTAAPWAIDLDLRASLQSKAMRERAIEPMTVSATNFADLYWTIAQQLAHLTANGASIRPGDLFASGTVSGPDPGTEGSLIERTWGGERPLSLPDGSTRTFLEDGDRVVLEGAAGGVVPLGAVEGEILGSTEGR